MKKEPVAKLVNLRKSYFMGKIEVPALCGVNYDFHEALSYPEVQNITML